MSYFQFALILFFRTSANAKTLILKVIHLVEIEMKLIVM